MLQDSSIYIVLVGVIACLLFLLGSIDTTSLFEGSEHDGIYNNED